MTATSCLTSAPLYLPGPAESARWPRLVTAAHPRAVGTYGPAALRWALERPQLHMRPMRTARWWQRYVLHRALEHDDAGRLIWQTVIVSAPRQVGKSYLERVALAWRLSHAEAFGEPQDMLHLAHKLVAAQEVWRPAARYFAHDGEGSHVRWANGEQMIERSDGSRWMIQAANDGAGVSFSLSLVLVDEAWRVERRVVDGALVPTMAESEQPQLWLVSTAGTATSDLMQSYRNLALASSPPADTDSLLIIEWSAPPDPGLDIDSPAVWRDASPHWDDNREQRVARARAETSEWDFRQQWLNQWVPAVSVPLFNAANWVASQHVGPRPDGPLTFGVDVAPDRSHAAILAWAAGVAEVVEYQPGAAWVPQRLAELCARWRPLAVAIDAGGPAASVIDALAGSDAEALLVALNGRELSVASAQLFDAITEGRLAAVAHPALSAAVESAARRAYGQSWVFARVGVGGVSGVALLALALARYAADHGPERVEASAIW